MSTKIRGFEPVAENFRKQNGVYTLPTRGSKKSAGYDFYSPMDLVIPRKDKVTFWTNVKAYMQEDEVLQLHVRSSIGIKKGLRLANVTGIIDSDYYSNPDNDGNIAVCLYNDNNYDEVIDKNERVMQGIFVKYLEADNGNTDLERSGGIGSSDK